MIDQQIPNPQSITSILNTYLQKSNNQHMAREIINQLLTQGTCFPNHGLNEEQKFEYRAIFTNITIGNNSNLGTVLGMTVFGVIGFLVLGFTAVGALGGGAVGVILGRYFGSKIQKKIATKGINLTEFDIFVIRVKCLIKWGKIIMQKYKGNLNLQRFCVQRILTEIKPLLHYKYFDDKFIKESKMLLNKIRSQLSSEDALYALCISYLLAKEYINIVKEQIIYSMFSTQEIVQVLNETVSDVLIPFLTLFSDQQKYQENQLIKILIQKISKLQVDVTVKKCLESYFDHQLSVEFIKMFSAKLTQKIKVEDLEKLLMLQNYRVQQQQEQIINQDSPLLEQEQMLRRKSVGDFTSYSEIIDQEIYAQIPLINEKKIQLKERAKSVDKNESQHSKQNKPFQISEIREQGQNSQQRSISQVYDKSEKRNSGLVQESLIQQNQLEMLIKLQLEHSNPQQMNRNQLNSDIQVEEKKYILSDELEEKFKLLVEILHEPITDWEQILKKENLIIYKTFKPPNPAVFVKGHGDLQGVNIEILLKAIHDEKYRQQWDKVLLNFCVLEKESDIVDIIYYYVQSPFGVSNREFCQKRILKYDYPKKGQIGLLYFSVDHPDVPKYKNHVRAETLISGYILDSIPGGSRLYFCSNNDVKGNIPKLISLLQELLLVGQILQDKVAKIMIKQ